MNLKIFTLPPIKAETEISDYGIFDYLQDVLNYHGNHYNHRGGMT